jgi:molybdopterin synthase catalytic subunit
VATESYVRVQEEDVAIDDLLRRARQSGVGGIVLFDGIVRDDDCDALELEAYEAAAVAELEEIARSAGERHGLAFVAVVHRTGRLAVGENIVVIVAAAGHRAEAFAACREILEGIKAGVPIWKKEYGPGGDRWIRGEHWPAHGP